MSTGIAVQRASDVHVVFLAMNMTLSMSVQVLRDIAADRIDRFGCQEPGLVQMPLNKNNPCVGYSLQINCTWNWPLSELASDCFVVVLDCVNIKLVQALMIPWCVVLHARYTNQFSDASVILATLRKPKPPVPAANIQIKYPKLQALMERRAAEKAQLEAQLAKAEAEKAEKERIAAEEEELRKAREEEEESSDEEVTYPEDAVSVCEPCAFCLGFGVHCCQSYGWFEILVCCFALTAKYSGFAPRAAASPKESSKAAPGRDRVKKERHAY